jgi:hypothetical protein
MNMYGYDFRKGQGVRTCSHLHNGGHRANIIIRLNSAGHKKMEELRSIVVHFPEREFDIRRRCARDLHFKSICLDYAEAARAFNHWRNVAKDGRRKKEADRNAEDYANLLSELKTEILAHLDQLNGRRRQ